MAYMPSMKALAIAVCSLPGATSVTTRQLAEQTPALQQGATWMAQLDSEATAASCKPRKEGGKVVLVTGTAGFIGYHSAMRLKERGDGVLGLDNFNQYYPVSLKRNRSDDLLKKVGVVTLEADLNDAEALQKAFEKCKFTHVLALAAQAGVRYAAKDPGSYVQSNVAGFTNLLEIVRRQDPLPRVVYASSSSVYGTNTKVPFSEADPVDHPASLYAATKREDELLAHTYNHIYKIALTGLRFFTVYGPFGRPDMALFSFANKITEGKPLHIFQGPNSTELERDFTFVDDIVRGCVSAVDHIGQGGEGAPLKVYNLGNEHPATVTQLVDLVEEYMGKKAIREYVPLPATGDVLRTHANVSLARQDLGYEPSTSFREGVQKFVEWYKAQYAHGLDADMKEYIPSL